MDIEIRVTPHSQSAELQIVINGEYDLKPIEENFNRYNSWYGNWYHDVTITITENSFSPYSGKQKMCLKSKLKTDGTNSINVVYTLIVYPLHSQTSYDVDFVLSLLNNNDVREEFTAHTNFSTQIALTKGEQSDRNTELTLKQKQINATYLYNQLVKRNRYSLESFCCLLGLSECAGNLNPAQYMIYKEYESDNFGYNRYDILNLKYDDYSIAYFGNYETNRPPYIWAINQMLYIPQNGIYTHNGNYYGTPEIYFERYGLDYIYYNLFNQWFYEPSISEIPKYEGGLYVLSNPPEDLKKSIAFGAFPFSRNYLLNAAFINGKTKAEFLTQQSWLNIDTIADAYKYLTTHINNSVWTLTNEHQQEYSSLWSKYNTFYKFTRSQTSAIKTLAEFMCHCFIDGNQGTLGTTTVYYDPEPYYVLPLYNIECVKERAAYWYNFFKKRRHPWWMYIKWNI